MAATDKPDFKPQDDVKLVIDSIKTIVLSCSDCRQHNLIHDYLNKDLGQNYNHLCVPGGALALVNPDKEYKKWKTVIMDQIGMLGKSHDSDVLMIIDHHGCFTYRAVYGEDVYTQKAMDLHAHVMDLAKKKMKKEFPSAKVDLVFIDENGQVLGVDNTAPVETPESYGPTNVTTSTTS